MHSKLTTFLLATAAAFALGPAVASVQDAKDVNVQTDVITLPEWHPEVLYEGGWSAEEFIDEAEVYGPTGEEIGDVENIIIGADGKVLSIIAEIGGFLEIGDMHVSVPWDQVEFTVGGDNVTIPVTQETVENYSLFTDPLLTATDAATDIQSVKGDNADVALTGTRAWRVTELIDDYTRIKDGDGFANYGYVDDVIIKDAAVASVVVRPDVAWGARGLYAYPYYGYGYSGWYPGLGSYDLPYAREEIAELEPFEYERFEFED
jgi:sporulation protein YlmC with PRC-barrel domain